MVVLNLIIFKKYNAIYVSLIDARYYDLLFQVSNMEHRQCFILSLPLELLNSKKMNQNHSQSKKKYYIKRTFFPLFLFTEHIKRTFLTCQKANKKNLKKLYNLSVCPLFETREVSTCVIKFSPNPLFLVI